MTIKDARRWMFEPGPVRYEHEGAIPHLQVRVVEQYVDGQTKEVGLLEIHLHRNVHGLSFGLTAVAYPDTAIAKES